MEMPCTKNTYLAHHAALMLQSFRRLLGRGLLPDEASPEEQARRLFLAPFVVLSHDTAEDPVFNYANDKALALFEMTWRELTSLPSRCSAEPMNREARERLLHQGEKEARRKEARRGQKPNRSKPNRSGPGYRRREGVSAKRSGR